MTKYEITEENIKSAINWKQIIKDSDCKVKPRKGTFELLEGHEDCSDCPGNYYNGGPCNFGENDCLLDRELEQINQNFEWVDALIIRHKDLRNSKNESDFGSKKNALLVAFGQVRRDCGEPKSFFAQTCISTHQEPMFEKDFTKRLYDFSVGIYKYLKQVEQLTYSQVAEFQTKMKEIQALRLENEDLENKIINSDLSLIKKAELNNDRRENNKKEKKLFKELDKHLAWILFDDEIDTILEETKQDFFEPKVSKPFAGLEKTKGVGRYNLADEKISEADDANDKDQQNNTGNWFTNLPWGQIALWGIGGLFIFLVGVYFWRSKE